MKNNSREIKEKFLSLDAKRLEGYIQNLEKETSLAKTCLKYVKKQNIPTGKERKEFLEDISENKLIKISPASALDPNNKKLGRHQKNTGIYLWKNGYEPKRFLGSGVNGVVWECENKKAVKVTCNKTLGPFNIVDAITDELHDVKKLDEIIKKKHKYVSSGKEKNIKTERYLSLSEAKNSSSNKKHIFESELAKEGTLLSKVKEIQGKKDVNIVIRMGTQTLKALKVLHDEGYSHNDVKPDNLLLVKRDSDKLKKQKDAIKLADFGAMTEIQNTKKIFGNSNFSPPDCYKTNPDAVAKRDVYALGAVLLFILVANKSIGASKKMAKELYSKGPDYFYDKYHLEEIYGNAYDKKLKVINLLVVIQLMVADSYQNRLTVDQALSKMLQIKNM